MKSTESSIKFENNNLKAKSKNNNNYLYHKTYLIHLHESSMLPF